MNAPTPDRPDLGTIENTETGATWVTWDDGRQPPWPQIGDVVSRLSGGAVLLRPRADDEEGDDRACVVIERGVRQLRPAPDLAAQLGDWPSILADVTQQRDELLELLDHETRLVWQSGLPGERARVAGVRESAGLEAL